MQAYYLDFVGYETDSDGIPVPSEKALMFANVNPEELSSFEELHNADYCTSYDRQLINGVLCTVLKFDYSDQIGTDLFMIAISPVDGANVVALGTYTSPDDEQAIMDCLTSMTITD